MRLRSSERQLGTCLILALVIVAGQAFAESSRCTSWPGEISPLPNVDHDDPLRSEWASRRSEELARLARTVEESNVVEAYRIWQHVFCLDSENEAARDAMASIQLVHVYHPQIEKVPAEPKTRRLETMRGAFAKLSETIRVGPKKVIERTPTVVVKRDRSLQRVDRKLAQSDNLVREARFREALALAKEVKSTLKDRQNSKDIRRRKVRTEVLTATAEVALGRKSEARASFGRALDLNPDLELDPMKTSPKVIRVFRGAKILMGRG